jgi:hypothetical protein
MDLGSRIQGSKRYRIPDPGSGSVTLEKTNIFPPKAIAMVQKELETRTRRLSLHTSL